MKEEDLLLSLLDRKNKLPERRFRDNPKDMPSSYRSLGLPEYEDQYIYVTQEEACMLYHRCGKLMVTWRSFLVVLAEVHKEPSKEDIRISFFPHSIINKDVDGAPEAIWKDRWLSE